MTNPLSPVAKSLVAAFAVSGVVHLVRPQTFTPIMPPQVPRPTDVVRVSGVAELACAVGLLAPSSRGVAGRVSAGLLVAVFPANVQMTVNTARAVAERGATPRRIAMLTGTIVRLPLQWPLIRAAWRTR